MDCKETGRFITEYVCEGGRCPRHEEVARHIVECDACRREAEELRAVLGVSREIAVPVPGPEFWEQRARSLFTTPHPGAYVRLKLAFSLAALVLVAGSVTAYQFHLRYSRRMPAANMVAINSAMLPSDDAMNELAEYVTESDPDLALNALLKK